MIGSAPGLRPSDLIRTFEAAAALLRRGSPKAAAWLKAAASACDDGGPWLERFRDAWQSRRFPAWFEPALLLVAALAREARRSDGHPLRGAAAGLERRVRQALGSPSPGFWAELAVRRVDDVGLTRAAAWMVPAALFFLPERRAFHLVDLGASTGLRLAADLGRPSWSMRAGGPTRRWGALGELVLTRRGFEAAPRAPDGEERDWLRCCAGPDGGPLWDAAQPAVEALASGRSGVRVHPAGPVEAAGLAADALPKGGGEGLLVYSATRPALTPPERRDFEDRLLGSLEPWGERAVWAEAGPVEKGFVLTLRRPKGAGWEKLGGAAYGPVPDTVEWE